MAERHHSLLLLTKKKRRPRSTHMDALWRHSCEEKASDLRVLWGREHTTTMGHPTGAAAHPTSRHPPQHVLKKALPGQLLGYPQLTIFKLSHSTSDALRATHLPCWKC